MAILKRSPVTATTQILLLTVLGYTACAGATIEGEEAATTIVSSSTNSTSDSETIPEDTDTDTETASEPDLPNNETVYEGYIAALDYRPMHLYKLKYQRYYNPPQHEQELDSDETPVVDNVSIDPYMDTSERPYFFDSTGDMRTLSYGQQINTALQNTKALHLLWSAAAKVLNGTAKTASLLWPYVGAASLTAVELRADSLWAITDYRINNGFAVRERDFNHSREAQKTAQQFAMFDRHHNPHGRFILFDQENWWGATDYPVDVEVTLTRLKSEESITIHIQREVTNNLQPGDMFTHIIDTNIKANNRYQITFWYVLPEWWDFEQWYHSPSRVLLQIDQLIAE